MTALDFLPSALKEFNYYKSVGERAMAQLSDEELLREPAPGSNSIAIIVNHLHGNMLSRWTDFLSTDGEKEWRERDREFEDEIDSRDELMRRWNEGWERLLGAIAPLRTEDVGRIVHIRTEPHTVAQATVRQLAHVPYHIGQIVLLAKLAKGEGFTSLTIPKGGSKAFNQGKGM